MECFSSRHRPEDFKSVGPFRPTDVPADVPRRDNMPDPPRSDDSVIESVDMQQWAQQLEARLIASVQEVSKTTLQTLAKVIFTHKETQERLDAAVDRLHKLDQNIKVVESTSPQNPQGALLNELDGQMRGLQLRQAQSIAEPEVRESLATAVQGAAPESIKGYLAKNLRDLETKQKDTTLDVLMAILMLKNVKMEGAIGNLVAELNRQIDTGRVEIDEGLDTARLDVQVTDGMVNGTILLEEDANSGRLQKKDGSTGDNITKFDVLGSEQNQPVVASGKKEKLLTLRHEDTSQLLEVSHAPSGTMSPSVGVTKNLDQSSSMEEIEAAEEAEAKEDLIAKVERLKASMTKTENYQDKMNKKAGQPKQSLSEMVLKMDTHHKDTVLDLVMAIIIVANSIVIGISMDHDVPSVKVIDACFTCCFLIELFCKFYLHGVVGYFKEPANFFDFLIVAFDCVQLVLEIVGWDILKGTPGAGLFRVVRILRLVRLLRLARLHALDDLVAMVSGMSGGMSTLFWAMMLFFLIMYVTSLLFREFFGKEDTHFTLDDGRIDMTAYFETVPRALFSVFRFFFGDFSTIDGWNLFEGVQLAYGWLASTFLCLVFFMITIGLFNVIAAIFVESTLAAANSTSQQRKTERMNNEFLWNSRITLLVRKFFEYNGDKLPEHASEVIMEYKEHPIAEAVFAQYMRDPAVRKALNDLEIDPADHKYLFDILDNDNTGSILVSQLTDGVERLRGDPRRSDIICVDLMVRDLQDQCKFLVKGAKANVESSRKNRAFLLKMDKRQGEMRKHLEAIMAHLGLEYGGTQTSM